VDFSRAKVKPAQVAKTMFSAANVPPTVLAKVQALPEPPT